MPPFDPRTSSDPASDPAVIERVLAEAEQRGDILRLPHRDHPTAADKYQAAVVVLVPVARGQQPITRFNDGMRLVLDGNTQLWRSLPVLFPARPLAAYRPQWEGITDATRGLVRLKDGYPIETALVQLDPALGQAADRADGLIGYIKGLDEARDAAKAELDPLLDQMYGAITTSVRKIMPAIQEKRFDARDIEAVVNYATGRYQKGVANRKDNAQRDHKAQGKLQELAADKQQKELADDLIVAFRRLQNEGQVPATPAAPGTTPATKPVPHGPGRGSAKR